MKKQFLSIIIPTYNSGEKLLKLLNSIFTSTYKNFEVIVIDDCSTDNTLELIKQFHIRTFKLEKNCGQADARNIGASKAKADILVFLDSDIILKNDALEKIAESFKDPKINCLKGIYAKEPANKGLFPRYKALFEFFCFKDAKTFSFFTPSLGAMRKQLFYDVGGFDKDYRHLEETMLGYKITKKYPIIVKQDIQANHHFPSFAKCIKNYFKRGFVWVRFFFKRKKFDNVGATPSTGISALLTIPIILSLALFFVHPIFLLTPFLLVLLFILLNAKMYQFIFKETNLLFMGYYITINFILQLVVAIAAISSLVTIPFFDERRFK